MKPPAEMLEESVVEGYKNQKDKIITVEDVHAVCVMSIAISLKRIADTLEETLAGRMRQ